MSRARRSPLSPAMQRRVRRRCDAVWPPSIDQILPQRDNSPGWPITTVRRRLRSRENGHASLSHQFAPETFGSLRPSARGWETYPAVVLGGVDTIVHERSLFGPRAFSTSSSTIHLHPADNVCLTFAGYNSSHTNAMNNHCVLYLVHC